MSSHAAGGEYRHPGCAGRRLTLLSQLRWPNEMDIMNALSEPRFREVDDVLAFISIYDDRKRIVAYRRLLRRHRRQIRGSVCVEAGCGLGIFAGELARLGARLVYAVEQNAALARLARQRLAELANVQVVESPIEDFKPPEPVDVLVHEFYGQLLFDEDLHTMAKLQFTPQLVLPDGGDLLCALVDADDYLDAYVSHAVLAELRGVLISGLFAENGDRLQRPVLQWHFGMPIPQRQQISLAGDGNLLMFGVRVLHQGEEVCRAGVCDNWALVWTPRAGDRFELGFDHHRIGEQVIFRWI